jgi:SAM-dependent methyltransferase
VTRACPVCGGAARTPLFTQRFAMIEGVSILDGYTVVACDDCGATFADGVPAQADFDRYYRESSRYAYSHRGGAESPADAARLTVSAAHIARHVSSRDANVVDVGCASGRLLAELRGLGFTRLRGIDPAPECAEAARRLHQVSAEAMTLGTLAERGDAFDVVVMIGVLEHLVDVGAAIDQLRRVTHLGSQAYFEVPDVTGFADLPNAPFQEFSVEHVNYFSLASLTRLLAGAGFRVIWHERGTPVQAGTMRVANLAVMAIRDDAPGDGAAFDAASRPAIERYVELNAQSEAAIVRRVDDLVKSSEAVVLWGAGTFALRLLATTRLAEARIAAIIDSNVRYQDRRVAGLKIVTPEAGAALGLPFIVVSHGFRDEITAQARAVSGPDPDIRGLTV